MACLEEKAATLWVMLVVLFFADISGGDPIRSILTSPTDVTSKVGGTAVFTCEVELKDNPVLTWEFNDDVIYYLQFDHESYPKGNSKYSVTQDGRNFVLKINDLQYTDGGKYTCQLLDEIVDANLLVIGTPELLTNALHLEGSTVQYTCKADFTGPKKPDITPELFPQLEMFFDGNPLPGTDQDTHRVEGATNYYELTQVHNITLQTSMHGKLLRCDVKTSSPELRESATTDVKVLYSVRNVSYTPNRTQYEVGSEITCEADGNPQPTFFWDFLFDDAKNPGNLIKGPSLIISESMIQSKTWRCTATNTVNGQLHQDSVVAAINVVLSDESERNEASESGNDSWKIAVGVAVPVCLVLIAGTAAFYFYFKIYKRPNKQSEISKNVQYESVATEDNSQANQVDSQANQVDSLANQVDSQAIQVDSQANQVDSQAIQVDSQANQNEAEAAESPEETNEPTKNQDVMTLSRRRQKEMAENYTALKSIIGRFRREEDLTDEAVKKVQNILPGVAFPPGDKSSALMLWVQKSKCLIGSDHYFTIMQGMCDILENQENLDEEPSLTLVSELEKDSSLAQNQTRLLTLLKILIPIDRQTDTRSRCMRVLLTMTREWGKCQGEEKNMKPLYWDAEFVELLKQLLQHGADPVWPTKGSYEGSNLQVLLKMMPQVIVDEAHLFEPLVDICKIMESSIASSSFAEQYGSILHELVKIMSPLTSDVKCNLLKLLKCLKTSSNVNIQDYQKNTPLHLLMLNVESWLGEQELFVDTVKCLESPNNKNVSNNDGSTPLGIFAESAIAWVRYPETFLGVVDEISRGHNVTHRDAQGRTALEIFSTSGETWKDYPETFLEVFKCLKSQINIIKDDSGKDSQPVLSSFKSWMSNLAYQPLAFLEIAKILCDTDTREEQDKYGNTMLHIYCPCAKECANQPKAFLKVVKCLKSPNNIEIMNASGETPLHIFTSEAIGWEDNSETFLDVVECLKSPLNIDDKNNDGNTALHIFISSRGRWEDSPAGFLEIVKCLGSPTNINMQNKKGETALHRFAGFKTEWANFKETFEIIKLLASQQNRTMTNHRGKNAVDLFKDNWGDRAEPFLDLATGQAV